jgi:hypothetical protein
MPSWTAYFHAFALLAITGMSLIMLSGFWRLLALGVTLAALVWLWQANRPRRK